MNKEQRALINLPRMRRRARFDCMTKATHRQVKFAIALLGQAGYSTNYMGAEFTELGATLQDRRGQVADWIKNMKVTECAKLIATLKTKAGEK